MRSLPLLPFALALLLPTAAPAQEKMQQDSAPPPEPAVALAGSYSVASSTQPGSSGQAYRGDVTIAGKPGRVFNIKWSLAGGAGNYAGLGVSNGTVLAAGYAEKGGDFGVVVYDRKGDRWEGAWVGSMTKGQAGFETLEAVQANGDGTGTFRIVKGTTPGSSGQYRGEVRIEKTGDTYTMTWKIAGSTHRGVGLMVGDSLVAGWTPRRDVGVVAYRISDGGAKLEGVWAPLGATQLGTEVLSRR